MNIALLKAIVANGEEYCRRYLAKYKATDLKDDWWQAFDFFLTRACFQGRLDKVSQLVYAAAYEVLTPLFSGTQTEGNFEAQSQEQWQAVTNQLRERIGKGKVGKARDIEMITSALSFVGTLPGKNIVAYSVSMIQSRKTQEHYMELQRGRSPKGIVQVGSKVAAFYLRDCVGV
jgi:hypothetical protein